MPGQTNRFTNTVYKKILNENPNFDCTAIKKK